MHKILMLAALLLSGCTNTVWPEQIAWAHEQCAGRGGLLRLDTDFVDVAEYLLAACCKDGTKVVATRKLQ